MSYETLYSLSLRYTIAYCHSIVNAIGTVAVITMG